MATEEKREAKNRIDYTVMIALQTTPGSLASL